MYNRRQVLGLRWGGVTGRDLGGPRVLEVHHTFTRVCDYAEPLSGAFTICALRQVILLPLNPSPAHAPAQSWFPIKFYITSLLWLPLK